jgi:predicted HTH transcriptional regulator
MAKNSMREQARSINKNSAIKASLIEAIDMSDEMSDAPLSKEASRQKKIMAFLQQHPPVMNADVRVLCGVSAATANRILAGLVAAGSLEKYREGGHWKYRVSVYQ